MEPLVSILIPCYNAAPWLRDTIDSALNQSWSNIEIIAVDDGSSDETLAILNSVKSSKLKVIQQENLGQCAAENRAFAESQGDFIEYLDADDLLSPDKIELQVNLLESPQSDYVAACSWGRFYKEPEEAIFKPQGVWKDMSPTDWLCCSWEGGGMMHGAAWLIPRHLIKKAGPWNESLSLINDFDFFTRVLLASKGIKFSKRAKTFYRNFDPETAKNLSSAYSEKALSSAFRSLELGTNALLAAEDSPRTRHASATSFQRFIYMAYPKCPDLISKATRRVSELGGSDLKPEGGPRFNLLMKLFGWKRAKYLQNLFYRRS